MTFFYRLTGKSDACGGNIHEYRKEFLFREVLRTMKVKRQEQIMAFLIEEFGQDRGSALFDTQEQLFHTLIESKNTENKSKRQQETLIQTILPCVALYKTLLQEGFSEEETSAYLQKYMFTIVGANMHSSMAKMERIPGFFFLYSSIFRKVMRSSDLHESTQDHTIASFDVTITKCLWHTACVENNCPKLCHIFCDADNVTYGGLKKLAFSRAKTLGWGEDYCDFHFSRK